MGTIKKEAFTGGKLRLNNSPTPTDRIQGLWAQVNLGENRLDGLIDE